VQMALDRLMQKRTVLVIAHRLSTVRNVDRILVLSGGEIIEEGTHRELMAISGEYKKLYELQFQDQDRPLQEVA
jgi:ABC-type multidrug transport system fused ATPase/permease subunit